MHSLKKILPLIALLAALAAGATAQAAQAPTPKIVSASLETAPSVDKKTVAVYFRTDTRIGRKDNRKSLDAYVGVLQAGTSSISTLRGGTSCYVGYAPQLRLKVGNKYAVEFVIHGKRVLKTLTLKKGSKATSHGSNVGC
jgi:hypothetical protein